ncbi:hypothetical protein P7K49_013920 [Saguinus oedipus]|uniref:Uncharacterized protein n=1 Tax=Saguinus oedipus TaxID=9490 RepID=A0ABQ9VHB8_SAGOE|nr:hypothetical protein P7K49_013920 [Saguinus oedipus]
MKTNWEPGAKEGRRGEGSAGASEGAAEPRKREQEAGCLGPRLAAPKLQAATAVPASKGRHVSAARGLRGRLRACGGPRRRGPGLAGRGCPRPRSYPITAAGAGPRGCAVWGSEAWRGFCTSGPTISQVCGLA